jgi:hypothetical protein
LENEDKKLRKRALSTKKKAAEIFFSKVLNEDKLRSRLKISMEKAQ